MAEVEEKNLLQEEEADLSPRQLIDMWSHIANEELLQLHRSDDFLNVFVNQIVTLDILTELIVGLLVGQLAVNDEVGCLKEVGVLAQVFNVVAAMAKDAVFTVDVGDFTFAGTRIDIAVVQGDQSGLTS